MNSSEKDVSAEAPLPSPIVIIGGGGKMGSALVKGLLETTSGSAQPPRIIATSRKAESMAHLPLPEGDKLTDNGAAVRDAKVIIVSVKPKYAASIFLEIAPALGEQATPGEKPLVISIIPGFSSTLIQSFLSKSRVHIPVVRAMPNLCTSIRKGYTLVCHDDYVTESAVQVTTSVFRAVGDVKCLSENLLPVATALTGSGIAYMFMAAEAMADAAVKHGLDRKTAFEMVGATIYGAGALLSESGEHPAVLRNSVESPGGVTIAATTALEDEGFRPALIAAIDAAVERQFEMEEEDDDEIGEKV